MGCGSYTARDWTKLKASRSITRDSTEANLFKTRKFLDKFNPKFIDMRESRDNDEHPRSTPIAIGLDVTGSMGYLPEKIIKEGLNELMKKLYATTAIPDPQLMFAAIGDVCDHAPLQVTQFESDIRIAEQLLDLWIEKGGGDYPEDYALMWYFLANHTDTDSMNKRNKKGYAFTIGDATNHDKLLASDIKRIFNEKQAVTYTREEAARLCQEKYELFHIMIDRQDEVIPGRTIYIQKAAIGYLPEVIITAICRADGIDPALILGQVDDNVQKMIDKALERVRFGKTIRL